MIIHTRQLASIYSAMSSPGLHEIGRVSVHKHTAAGTAILGDELRKQRYPIAMYDGEIGDPIASDVEPGSPPGCDGGICIYDDARGGRALVQEHRAGTYERLDIHIMRGHLIYYPLPNPVRALPTRIR
jgi:hypothetical protein